MHYRRMKFSTPPKFHLDQASHVLLVLKGTNLILCPRSIVELEKDCPYCVFILPLQITHQYLDFPNWKGLLLVPPKGNSFPH